MTLYHVTTEGDCEGRTTKDLGYVEADSPEHAIKYLHSIGKYAYYEYYIHEIEENPIQVATPKGETVAFNYNFQQLPDHIIEQILKRDFVPMLVKQIKRG